MKAIATLSEKDMTFDPKTHRPIPIYFFDIEITEFDEILIWNGSLETDDAFISVVMAVRDADEYPFHFASPRIYLGDDFRFTGLGKVEGFAFVESG